MAKRTVILAAGMGTLTAVAAAGYYFGQAGVLPSPSAIGENISLEHGSCASVEITSKVLELIKSQGVRTKLLRVATEQKMEELASGMASEGNTQYAQAVKDCIATAATDGNYALQAAGITGQQYDPEASAYCSKFPPKVGEVCHSILDPIERQKDQCYANARSGNDQHTISNQQSFDQQRDVAVSQVKYDLSIVRTTSVDRSVGSKVCTARLNAHLPSDWGGAEEDVSYKVERTAGGDLFITLLNTDQL